MGIGSDGPSIHCRPSKIKVLFRKNFWVLSSLHLFPPETIILFSTIPPIWPPLSSSFGSGTPLVTLHEKVLIILFLLLFGFESHSCILFTVSWLSFPLLQKKLSFIVTNRKKLNILILYDLYISKLLMKSLIIWRSAGRSIGIKD
ncbi:hypothetical protein SDC9_150433 [bioreactor metagenome]|uniref:Uncharacterized protein n=1 Tax=bioreactor metagenome TaxID=1076179 RepID=A0A645EN13_9ZZZZ